MTSTPRSRRVTIAASVGLLAAGGATLTATVLSSASGHGDTVTAGLAPAQPADTEPADTGPSDTGPGVTPAPLTIPETEAIVITDPDEPAASPPETEGPPGFADGRQASEAAEALIAGYIAAEFGVGVTDPACSVPETGDVGATFVCYGLQPDDLVIALRATVGDERLIRIELITDQAAPPDATETTVEG